MSAKLPRMLRRADAVALLAEYGVTEHEFDKLISAGTLTRITLRRGGRGYYVTAEIQRLVIDPVHAAESAHATSTRH